VAIQPETLAAGAVEDSVAMKPVTPTLSVAVNDVIGTVNDVEVAGIVNELTVGGCVSGAGGSVIVVGELREVETLPAASLAQP
jgi:hypothetical protein